MKHASSAYVFDEATQRLKPHLSEEAIHRAVARILTLSARRGVFWFHPANGEARSKAAGGRLKAMGLRAGVPDLCVLYHGQVFFLELKTTRGRLSPRQNEVCKYITDAGGTFMVAHGIDEAIDILRKWGVLRVDLTSGGPS